MPHPIQSSSSSSVMSAGYYDMEGGQCVEAEPPAPPVCAKSEAPAAGAGCASGAGPSQAAVDRLVMSQVRKPEAESCATKIIGATLKCTQAAIGAAMAETGVGAVKAGLSVADCALGTVEAYQCLTRSE